MLWQVNSVPAVPGPPVQQAGLHRGAADHGGPGGHLPHRAPPGQAGARHQGAGARLLPLQQGASWQDCQVGESH